MHEFKNRTRGILATAAVTALAAGLVAAPAQAHVNVINTKPGKGDTASTSIKSVKVTFSGTLISGKLRVYGPKGKPSYRKASKGKGGRDPRSIYRLTTRMKGGLKPGKYVARWSITAADGHSQEGSFSFRLER